MKDKVVIVFTGEPKVDEIYLVSDTTKASIWGFSTTKKAILARQKGAVALLVVNPQVDSLSDALAEKSKQSNISFPGETNSKNEKVPVIIITPGVLKNIIGEQQASELITAAKAKQSLKEFDAEKNIKSKLAYKKIKIPAEASNVIGFIEGTDKKDEYVFLTAHYDHLGKKGNAIYYGADDDGSGTAAVIEMARAFAKAKADGFGPRRTVVFMTVSGEEEGLWGSEYYSDHPAFSLDRTTVDLNTDMIGRIDAERKTGDTLNYIYVIGHDKLSTDLPVINEGVNNEYSHLTLDYKFDDPLDKEKIYFRSDHYNFARKGVPVLFFYDGMLLGDYHKPTDTIEKINWELYEKRTRFIFLNAWEIANRNNMLKRDLPLPSERN